jgi:Ca2+-binding EF-hand superfamily protein
LLGVFKEYEIDELEQISKIELFSLLDQRAKHEFDRNVAAELFSKMDEDNDELINFEQFFDVFVTVEEELNFKIAKYKDRLIELKNLTNTWTSKLSEAERKEKNNSFGRL